MLTSVSPVKIPLIAEGVAKLVLGALKSIKAKRLLLRSMLAGTSAAGVLSFFDWSQPEIPRVNVAAIAILKRFLFMFSIHSVEHPLWANINSNVIKQKAYKKRYLRNFWRNRWRFRRYERLPPLAERDTVNRAGCRGIEFARHPPGKVCLASGLHGFSHG